MTFDCCHPVSIWVDRSELVALPVRSLFTAESYQNGTTSVPCPILKT